jgi:hypothetical protein
VRVRGRGRRLLAAVVTAATTIAGAAGWGGGGTASASAAARAVVLGSKSWALPDGYGFGTAHPRAIFNGGDPSGLVTHLVWRGWGTGVATASGRNAIFKPGGGYYGKLVTIELRAYDLGRCTAGGPPAYRKLAAREPSRPGGPPGKWFAWAGARTICGAR